MGHTAGDHVGETSDIVGSAAGVVQAVDQGAGIGALNTQPFLPGSAYQIDGPSGFPLAHVDQSPAVAQTFNGIGAVTGAIGAFQGGNDMLDPEKSTLDRVIGGGNLLSGLAGTAGSLASMCGVKTGVLGGLAQAGGTFGMGADVLGGAAWGAGAGSTGAAVGTGLATGGSILGAALAGYGVGSYGDEHMKETGFLDGRSISDWGADKALAVEEKHGHTAGALASLGYAIPGAAMAVGSTVHGLGSAAIDLNTSVYGGIYDWLTK